MRGFSFNTPIPYTIWYWCIKRKT